jgi:hypothetical protein
MIPKIIHQIAPTEKNNWDIEWKPCHESWKTAYSDFKFMMWDDENINLSNLIGKYYPEYSEKYRILPYNIMRYDIGRCFLMYHYGGIYADMDLYCHKKFDTEIHKSNAIVEDLETKLTYDYNTKEVAFYSAPNIFSNFLLVSKKPKDIFWLKIINWCFKQCEIILRDKTMKVGLVVDCGDPKYIADPKFLAYISNTTGPNSISSFLKNYQKDFTPLKSNLFTNNVNQKYNNKTRVPFKTIDEQISITEDFYMTGTPHNRYTTHYETTSWLSGIRKT